MSIESNKAIVGRLEEIWNEGRFEIVDEVIGPDFVAHVGTREVTGKDAYRSVVQAMRAGMPDLDAGIEAVIAEGDRVVTRGVMTGTHDGELLGVSPTGRRLSFSWTNTYRLQDGLIVEQWGNHDDLGLMQQLGLLPS